MMAGTTEGGSPAEAPQCPFLRGRSAAAMGDPFRQRGGLSQLQGDSVKTGLNPQKGNESPAVTALWKSCLEAQANHLGKPGKSSTASVRLCRDKGRPPTDMKRPVLTGGPAETCQFRRFHQISRIGLPEGMVSSADGCSSRKISDLKEMWRRMHRRYV